MRLVFKNTDIHTEEKTVLIPTRIKKTDVFKILKNTYLHGYNEHILYIELLKNAE